MDELLGRAWWMLILRGTVALLFGILALFLPGLTLLLLITLFSAYAIVGGIVAILAAIRYRATHGGWWVPLLFGICSIGAGVIAVLVPGITTLVLVAVIGANAMITGVFDLIAATRLHRRLRNAWIPEHRHLAFAKLSAAGGAATERTHARPALRPLHLPALRTDPA